jgi:hypothetical protein
VSKDSPQKDKRYELWGWILFTFSALFFIVSSLRNGDIVGLLGGAFLLLACAAFLASHFGTHKDWYVGTGPCSGSGHTEWPSHTSFPRKPESTASRRRPVDDGALLAALLSRTCDHAHYSDEVPE